MAIISRPVYSVDTLTEMANVPHDALAFVEEDGSIRKWDGTAWTKRGAPLGTLAGQIPTIPVPMSSMSSGVKGTLDPINALTDSAAFHESTAFTPASHLANLLNPHIVTATQVGLGNTSNVRSRKLTFHAPLVNMNNTLHDSAIFTGLPAFWRIESFTIARPSSSLATVAKAGLFSGPLGTGTAIVASALVSCATGLANDLTITAGVKNAIYNFPSLYLYNLVGLGVAATASFELVLNDWSD